MEINSVPSGGTISNLLQKDIDLLLEQNIIWWFQDGYVYDKDRTREIELILNPLT